MLKKQALLFFAIEGALFWGLFAWWRYADSSLAMILFMINAGVLIPISFMIGYKIEMTTFLLLEEKKELCERPNEKPLIRYLREKFTYFFSNAVTLMVSTAGLLNFIRRIEASAANQAQTAEQVDISVQAMTDVINEIASSTDDARVQAEKTLETAYTGAEIVEGNVERMQDVIAVFEAISASMGGLKSDTEAITKVMTVIQDISNQTNLLSLNAAIEAAKAGEHGKGFAIVAEEVRNLAAKTHDSSDDITSMVGHIMESTSKINNQLKDGTKRLDEGKQTTMEVKYRFDEIVNQAQANQGQIESVAVSIEEQSREIENIGNNVAGLTHSIQDIHHSIAKAAETIQKLSVMGEGLLAHILDYKLDTRSSQVTQKLQVVAKRIAAELENAEKTGVKIWDRNYTAVEGTNPLKHHVKYLDWIGKSPVQKWQDEMQKAEKVVFVVLVDENGYLPIHNSNFDHALTGDPAVDLGKSRSRRIFNDFTGLRAGQNTEPVLMQVYMRDTGEVMVDLSVPVYVNKKHWGGLRLGFMPKEDLLDIGADVP